MLSNKDIILKEMKELEGTLAMYKEAFPDNPAFMSQAKRKEKLKKEK